ncbi:MAG TPA: HAMP domain-containing sensor histidine kinase, partial [Nitrososphaeraceae archaeon]
GHLFTHSHRKERLTFSYGSYSLHRNYCWIVRQSAMHVLLLAIIMYYTHIDPNCLEKLRIPSADTDMAKTRILRGSKNTTNAIIRLISQSKTRIDVCCSYKVQSLAISEKFFRKAIVDAKKEGLEFRIIMKITKDNILYCRNLMKIVELRHLDGLKGNFLLNEKECVYATPILKERKIIPRLLYTNINEFLEQQHNFFDTFWNNSISAQERIRQIEGEIQPHHIDIIHNSKRAEFLFVSEVRSARSEVLILVDSIDFLRYLAEIGLVDSIIQAKNNNANVIILYSEGNGGGVGVNFDEAQLKTISDLKEYAQIRRISGIQGNILIIDNSKVLAINEEVDGTFDNNAFAVYSDNQTLVNNFGALLDALSNEAVILDSIIVAKDNLANSNKQLAEANEQLKLRDKLQQEFINIAAHELRTPIMPILGYAELLSEDIGRDKLEYIEKIIKNANRLQRFAESILDVTKIESRTLNLKKEKLNLNDLILTVIDDLTLMKSKKDLVKLRYQPREEIIVEADRNRLSQVISNLLINAYNFTKEGFILITAEKSDDNLTTVRIEDSGSGIDAEIMPRLFSKFATSSSSGTGLGLFISKSIIQAHGGNIWAENNTSRNKKGAVFAFSIPLIK